MSMGPPRWVPWIFVAVAVILFAVAAGFALNNLRYGDAETATGTIIEHKYAPIRSEDDDGRSRSRDAWKAVVEWTDHEGESHTTVGNVSSTHPKTIGSEVTVQYFPDDVGSARLADFWDQWLVTVVTGGMGLVFALFGVVFLSIFRRVPALATKDLPRPGATADLPGGTAALMIVQGPAVPGSPALRRPARRSSTGGSATLAGSGSGPRPLSP